MFARGNNRCQDYVRWQCCFSSTESATSLVPQATDARETVRVDGAQPFYYQVIILKPVSVLSKAEVFKA